jgi:amino acid transporter
MKSESRLRSSCLNFWELLAQAIALISPTMTAALIVPLMYGSTGITAWVAYLFGTVMLLLVALNLNQFARRQSGTGSMYAYTWKGLGASAGGLSGWCLIWAYTFIGIAGTTGFTVFATKLISMAGMNVDAHPHVLSVALFAGCIALSWIFAFKDIQFSTLLMLVLEGLSMLLIVALCMIFLGQRHFVPDTQQFDIHSMSLSGIGLGVVVAIFSLVGFECATAFGDEARNPLKSIPRAVIASLLITGAFFVFVTYCEVYGLRSQDPPLDKLDAPLNVLAQISHMSWLQAPLSIAAMISFFALALSCMNAGARVMFAMGQSGVFHGATAKVHSRNETPHVALVVMSVMMMAVPTVLRLKGSDVLDVFNWAGTFGAFGFLAAYFLISIAAPVYLKREGALRPKHIVYSVLALICLIVPAVGTVYPLPDPPVRYFAFIFLGYLAVGAIWLLGFRRRIEQPESWARMPAFEVVAPDAGKYPISETVHPGAVAG